MKKGMDIGYGVESVCHRNGHGPLKIQEFTIAVVLEPPSWETLVGLQGQESEIPGNWDLTIFPALFLCLQFLSVRALHYRQEGEVLVFLFQSAILMLVKNTRHCSLSGAILLSVLVFESFLPPTL